MNLEHDKDEHAITMFVLRYEAKVSPEAKTNYLRRFKRIMEEEGVNIPLVPQSDVDRLRMLVEDSIKQTDKCLDMMQVFTAKEADAIMPLNDDK